MSPSSRTAPDRHDGLVLWHRIDAVEAGTRQVSLGVDGVLALGAVADPDVVEVGEEVVPLLIWAGPGDPDLDRGATVPLPDTWGPGPAAGDLVALQVDGDRLRLAAAGDVPDATRPAAGAGEAAVLGAALARLARSRGHLLTVLRDPDRDADGQWVVDLADSGQHLLDDGEATVRALHRLPVREAIVMAGLRVRACAVAGPDVAAQQLETYMVGRIVSGGLVGGSVVEACGVVYGALSGPWREGDDPPTTSKVLAALLADPVVTGRVVDHLRAVGHDVVGEAEWRMRPVRHADPEGPGPAWVHAALLLRQGRPRDAQATLEQIVAQLDGRAAEDWPQLVECAARLRAMCGDIAGASALGRRVEAAGYLAHLDRWLPPRPRVSRNAACPCGSGAKAKVCCLVSPAPLPLGPRVDLLWEKVVDWALAEQVAVSAAVSQSALTMDPVRDIADLDAAVDAQLLEGRALNEVLDEIGALLPPDEQDLACRWRIGRHALWAADAIGGRRVVLTELSTGERAAVVGRLDRRSPFVAPPVGVPVLAAVLPGPVGHHVVGEVLPVAPADVDLVRDLIRWGIDAPSLRALRRALRQAGPDGLAGRPTG